MKNKRKKEFILDALSLGAVLQYVIYRFLQSTMFVIYFSEAYKLLTMFFLMVFGGIRYIYMLIKKWRVLKEKNERKNMLCM